MSKNSEPGLQTRLVCPNCANENPTAARFCQHCGQALPRPCPSCATLNAAEAYFCMNCGFALKGASVGPDRPSSPGMDGRLAQLTAAAPIALAEQMRSSQHLAGERRLVTSLFADVVGSTSLAGQMDPEDWAILMNQAFEALVPVIYRYEGTIARLMGDALLAFFGAPLAHEDDPVRAVHAGLDLLTTARQFAEEVRQKYGVDFALRVGLNTGTVVVGEVGSNLIYEYTAMGDAVNLAARMQAAARPMTLLITDNTHRFIAHVFETTDLGPIQVKGMAEPVHVFEVTSARLRPKPVRGLPGLYSPQVGRDAEMAALLKVGRVVQAGLGRGVLVIGEAGLGKSRLIAEWKERMTARQAGSFHWIEGRCLSYGQDLAYHLLIDVLRSATVRSGAAREGDDRSALKTLLENIVPDAAAEVYPSLGHLLSVRLDQAALEKLEQLNPQAMQAKYLSAARKLLQALAAQKPVVVVCEDIHWVDPSSASLLIKLLPLAREIPLLLCFVTRPDREAVGWKVIAAARQTMGAGLIELNLASLSEVESCQMVTNILQVEALPDPIRDLILRKSEGNPFFVEEVIRMLVDQNIIVRNENGWFAQEGIEGVEIPDTLHGLLLARIDRLPEDVKHVLRVASVLGRQFSLKVLEQVLEDNNP